MNPRSIAFLSSAGIFIFIALRLIAGVSETQRQIPIIAVLILCGPPLLFNVGRQAMAHEAGADLLAAISIVAAALMGEYLVGGIVVLMLSGGRTLERYATQRASVALEAIAKRAPRIAHLALGSGVREVSAEDVLPEQIIRIFPYEICPVDGVVMEGTGTMDESYLTGEPFQIEKTTGSRVLSGAINGSAPLTVRAVRPASESRFAQIMKVMQQSEQTRPHLRRVGDRIGGVYAPFVLVVATLAGILSGIPERFLAVLVIATPCPIILAIPIAIIGAISTAARRGIIVKDPKGLEQAGECRTFIFDKTGTLTYGIPYLEVIETSSGFGRAEVLESAASLEKYSKHPLAMAILNAARAEGVMIPDASAVSELPGQGLKGIVSGRDVSITGRNKIDSSNISLPPSKPGLECLVLIQKKFAGLLRFRDQPREEGREFISHLNPKHGPANTILLSGDRGEEVKYLAGLLGIHEVHYDKSPEEKVEIVRKETAAHKTLYLGDGINDAPALMLATVGVAFGKGSDITAEAADAVILEPSLEKVDEFIHIGKRMRRIALQSAIGGMALSSVGIVLAILGRLSPLEGAIAQEVIDLIAILNALRVAFPPKKLADF